jgi:hypothetical protein
MSRPDAAASAALDAAHIKPIFFVYLDVLGDVLRANSSGADATPASTGDTDLDGLLFTGIGAAFVDISSVKVQGGGSDSVTATLSGLPEIDGDVLNTIGNRANWQGREARLWRVIRDGANVQQGGFQHYYTGYMTALNIEGTAESQTITVTIETYLAAFSAPSNRTYLDQERYDAGDLSARAAIAIANGISGNPLIANTGGGSSGGGIGGGGRGVGTDVREL